MVKQKELPCRAHCPYSKEGLRPCGTGYKTHVTNFMVDALQANKLVPDRPMCRTNLTSLIDELDLERPEEANMTDGDPTLPFLLTISYHTDRGIIPAGGVYDGIYYPPSQDIPIAGNYDQNS